MYTFDIPEDAEVGTTVGRIMADDADIGINARMVYSLEDLEESSTFTIQTDPKTQEGVILLAKVTSAVHYTYYILSKLHLKCTKNKSQSQVSQNSEFVVFLY